MINEVIKDDRRIRKTKKAIKKAFLVLLGKYDIRNISVTEISKLADINRKTFYTYYKDIFAVRDELENDVINNTMDSIGKNDITRFLSDPFPALMQITKIMNEDIEFHNLLFKEGAVGAILEKAKRIFEEQLLASQPKVSKSEAPLTKYTVSYFTAGLLYAYELWFNSEKKIPLEELSKHLSKIAIGGIQVVKDKN